MVFYGLQKLSMVDYPGLLAATVFTGGCNLRCPFCHNSSLLDACRAYFAKTGRRISFEYAMIDGVNDTEYHARLLAKRAKEVRGHVNLIPLNYVEEYKLKPSTPGHLKAFIRILEDEGVNVTVRRRLGSDVDASCGQLRRKMQKK